MNAFDFYKAKVQDESGNSLYNSTKHLYEKEIKNSPFYKIVTIIKPDKREFITGSRIMRTKESTKKEAHFAPEEFYNIGDYLSLDEKIWLMVDFDPNELFPKGHIEECTTSLKWTDTHGKVFEYPCIFYFNTKSNFGVIEDRNMTIPDGRRLVIVQANKDTLTLKRDMRFIFNDRAWRIIDYDYQDQVGLMILSLEETQIKENDNLVERLPNYKDKKVADTIGKYIVLNGNNEIGSNRIKEYTVNVFNGDNMVFEPVAFHLLSEDGISPTPLAAIKNQNGVKCEIESFENIGYVKLIAELISNKEVIAHKTIRIAPI